MLGQGLRGVVANARGGPRDDDGPALGRDGEALLEENEDELVGEKQEDEGGPEAHRDAHQQLGRELQLREEAGVSHAVSCGCGCAVWGWGGVSDVVWCGRA